MLTLEYHGAISGFQVLFRGQVFGREPLTSSVGLQVMHTGETTPPISVSVPDALGWHLEGTN